MDFLASNSQMVTVSDSRKVKCKWFQPTLEKGAVVLNVLYKRDQCGVELYPAWPIWSRNLTPSTQGTFPLSYLLVTRDLVF
jgi:hypothetical protein